MVQNYFEKENLKVNYLPFKEKKVFPTFSKTDRFKPNHSKGIRKGKLLPKTTLKKLLASLRREKKNGIT